MEAEYMFVTKEAKEGILLKGLILDYIRSKQHYSATVEVLSAWHGTKCSMTVQSTLKSNITWSASESRIKIKKISIDHNPADMLTKPVSFKLCLDLLIIDSSWRPYGVSDDSGRFDSFWFHIYSGLNLNKLLRCLKSWLD